MQQPQSFGRQITGRKHHAGNIAARPAETGDQAGSNRINAGYGDDRNGGGCRLGCLRRYSVGNDYGDWTANQIGRQRRQTVMVIVGPAILNRHILSFDESGLVQTLAERSDEAVGRFGLELDVRRPIGELPLGVRQSLEIVRALALADLLGAERPVLLLDEPTTALDIGFQFEIASLLSALNRERGTTMVVSTHDLNFAAMLCTELVLLKAGRVLAAGATKDVLTAANIRRLYDVDADVTFHPRAGHLTVVPLARTD